MFFPKLTSNSNLIQALKLKFSCTYYRKLKPLTFSLNKLDNNNNGCTERCNSYKINVMYSFKFEVC